MSSSPKYSSVRVSAEVSRACVKRPAAVQQNGQPSEPPKPRDGGKSNYARARLPLGDG